jgi:phosphoribosylamine--glycine ligase
MTDDGRLDVLVVGGGGREHALVRGLARSARIGRLVCGPGNAGIAADAEVVNVAAEDVPAIVAFAEREGIDLVVVGPEAPLVAGLGDQLRQRGFAVFGPNADGARLEGSKAFAKEVMSAAGVPTGDAATFTDYEEAKAYLAEHDAPIVIKADGLAAGKGVFVALTAAEAEAALAECFVERRFGEAAGAVLIEEYLEGEELSLLSIVSGLQILPLAPAQDYKRALDGDKGPNTGGMGSYSPVPSVDDALYAELVETVVRPTVDEIFRRSIDFRGVLYTGLMLTSDGPKVLEFNCRFGDPETQAIIPRMQSDLLELLWAAARGEVLPAAEWREVATVGVVMASRGYPASSSKGDIISGLADAGELPGVEVLHAATARSDGDLVTSGGRVLTVTGTGDSFAEARDRAYAGVALIGFDGAQHRSDIALRAEQREVQRKGEIMADRPLVGILMGSQSDSEIMDGAAKELDTWGISYEVNVISAHRDPEQVREYSLSAESRGLKVIIAGAGKAAALPGVVASMTELPVIGVPIRTSDLGGLDSLLSMVQMPAGVPVATVAINGARNAAILAARILRVGGLATPPEGGAR